MVLSGDSLLVGDVGRPDFGGGDPASQFESLRRLLQLPDWVAVFPGHFEGPCGRGMCGRPSTTIGFERLYNPLAHLERAASLAAITSEVPARPLNMTAIEATNRGVAEMPWAMLTTAPVVQEIDVDALASRSAETMVVDVREPEEYAQGGTLAWRAAGKPLAFGEHSADKPRIIESTWAHAGVFSPQEVLPGPDPSRHEPPVIPLVM